MLQCGHHEDGGEKTVFHKHRRCVTAQIARLMSRVYFTSRQRSIQSKRMIRGNTKIGPALEVADRRGTRSVRQEFFRSVTKKMIRLLRHGPSVLREGNGAVEFRMLAPMFRSEFTSSQYWSIRTWLNHLQKGGGPKKRFRYCVDPCSADTILYLRASQGHSGGKRMNPTLQDNVLFPSDFAEQIYHVGSSHDTHWIIQRCVSRKW